MLYGYELVTLATSFSNFRCPVACFWSCLLGVRRPRALAWCPSFKPARVWFGAFDGARNRVDASLQMSSCCHLSAIALSRRTL